MVNIERVKNRSWLFTFDSDPRWNLNVHLITGEQRDYVIDTGLGSLSMEPVKPYLQTGKPVVVINTHYHWDHVWGNAVFEGSLIVSHSLCYQRLNERWDQMLERHHTHVFGEVEKSLPNLVFDDAIYFPDDGIRLFFTPGHSADSISVYDERDGVLNAGDNIGDDPENIVPELECDKTVYADMLTKLKNTGADTVVSGHNIVQRSDVLDRILHCL